MPPFVYFTSACITGIALAWWLSPEPPLLFMGMIPVLGGLYLYRKEPQPRLIIFCFLFTLLGAMRFIYTQPIIDESHVAFYNDDNKFMLTGTIVDEPDARERLTNLRLSAQTITLESGQTIPVHGLVLVKAGRYQQYQYGDTLSVFAELETPPEFEGFSYKDYLAQRDIYTMMRQPRIQLLQKQTGFSIYTQIYRFKASAHHGINRILPEPHASLLNGILLGIRSGIPQELYNDFNATGASHVIVISGSNISIVIAIIIVIGRFIVGIRHTTVIAAIGVIMYVIMVGADAAVVRAALMGLLYVTSIRLGRGNDITNALFGAALFMMLYNPMSIWDVGFQLSFVATWGLVAIVPILESYTAKYLGWTMTLHHLDSMADILREGLLVTLAAQIAVTPLLIYHFGQFSIISVLTNLLIVPVQPFVMSLGGLATFATMIFEPLGKMIGWFAWLPLAWTVLIVEWTADFTWAQIELIPIPFWLVGLSYLVLGFWMWMIDHDDERLQLPTNHKRSWSFYVIASMLVIGILILAGTYNMPDGKLHVAFLDIGQGDAILITTPNGRQMLIDGGPSTTELGRRLGHEIPFWDRSLDIVVNTHPDADHVAGLVDVISRFDIGIVLTSDVESESGLYAEWLHRLYMYKHPVRQAWQGMTFQLDDNVHVEIFNPSSLTISAESKNDHSVAMRVTMDEISFLLTGDVEKQIEQAWVAHQFDLKATVLKSPHHGSSTSSSHAFLSAVNPQFVVISVGEDNTFGHPTETIIQRYADFGMTILRTDELGTIEFITDGQQLWLETRW